MKEDKEDMRAFPEEGSPISLKKVSELRNREPVPEGSKDNKSVTCLIDNSASGFVNDDPGMTSILISDRDKQAEHFIKIFPPDTPLPPYLKEFIEFMYEKEVDADKIFKFASTNQELKQIIGLIQLIGGALNMAKKQKAYIRLYVEEPEARLHPKRQRMVMSMIEKLRERYEYNYKSKDGESDINKVKKE